MALGIIIGLTYTPVMIRLLGKSEYGLYNTVTSTISMLSILSLGFNSSYVRYYARYRKDRDENKIWSLNGLFLIIFTVIGAVALACGLFLTNHLDLVFDKGLTPEEYSLARILMLLLTINLSLSFPMSVFSTIISANERFVFLKLIGMIKSVLSPLVSLPLLLMGFRSVGLVVIILILHVVNDFICIYYVIIKLHNKFAFSRTEPGLLGDLFGFTVFLAINIIVDQINTNVDRVLLGRYQGTGAVAVYAVGASLFGHYQHLSTAISGVFTPRIHRIYNEEPEEDSRNTVLSRLFVRVGRIQFLLLALVASGMLFFGRKFITLWAGSEYGTESYYVALLLILPATIPLIQNLGIEIQRAANKHRFRSIAYLIMAFANIIMTIFLCQLYGAVGAAIGTAISYILVNGIVMNLYYFKKLHINIPLFWKNIMRIVIRLLPAFAVGTVIWRFVEYSSVPTMLLLILAYTVVYLVCALTLAMNQEERNLVLSPLKRIKARIEKK